ncbi:MAG TPA: CDP-archaeol synthase, partial [Thiotrichales bacterium]|nr:CDP-archaeol synthase [Thiotrichales bacterium]
MGVDFFQLLLLIIIANGAPILIRDLFLDCCHVAVDFGRKLPDGQPLFGASKTWRGIVAALLITTVVSVVLGYPAKTGLMIAAFAVLGDLSSSFIKRRLAMKPSSMAPLLDQVPESLFPALMVREVFHLDISSVMLLVLIRSEER